MERYVCIHGHFYQPPRENPWLEAIEVQDSAYPWHDWNERITAECYAANASSRIFDDQGRIVKIVNNYAKISFDFGPTLLSWMEKNASDVYDAVLEADQESQRLYSGHGSALAQAYNHMILPLANGRDKDTQILWGIRDFEHRFGRRPEGMWLPETAVDLETLDLMAERGIHFTILAPHQARRVRAMDDGAWGDVPGGTIDTAMPYLLNLPSGRTIVLFFYDGLISRAVAFENLLIKGESFVQRILNGFADTRDWPQLLHIATDGETYGHHHRFGDMTLAYALELIESQNLARLTNYGEYLERHPPTHEVEIFEHSSWSCIHGVERWRSDCGCNSGAHPEWHQGWRRPLREALDWFRDILASAYREKAGSFLKDPWGARDDYIQIILDRARESIERFLGQHAVRVLNDAEKTTVFELLEIQRHAMLMYTSCGWFFDEISGIEAVQVLKFAGRALHLSHRIFGDAIEPRFLELLERAKSNLPEHRDGRRIYEDFVRPAIPEMEKIGTHYAISSLFEEYSKHSSVYCYTANQQGCQSFEAGGARLVLGGVKLTSQITRESTRLCFGALYQGDHNLNCSVGKYPNKQEASRLWQEISETFAGSDFPKTLRLMGEYIGTPSYSLESLFRDQQRKILDLILESTLKEAEAVYGRLYEHLAPMMGFLSDLGIPPPKVFCTAAELVLNTGLRRAFENADPDPEIIKALLEKAGRGGVSLDTDTLEYTVRQRLVQIAETLQDSPTELPLLQKLEAVVSLTNSLPFQVDMWEVQNIYYGILQTVYPKLRGKAEKGNTRAKKWVDHFASLGERLSVRVEQKRYFPTLPLFPFYR